MSRDALRKTVEEEQGSVATTPHVVPAEIPDDFFSLTGGYQAEGDEEYMNARQIAYFQDTLSLWLTRLEESGKRTIESLKRVASGLADENDRASSEEQLSLSLRWHERGSRLARKLKETLARIDRGEFGYCGACEEEIGLQRLQVRPTASLCIDCKQIQEIKERQGTQGL